MPREEAENFVRRMVSSLGEVCDSLEGLAEDNAREDPDFRVACLYAVGLLDGHVAHVRAYLDGHGLSDERLLATLEGLNEMLARRRCDLCREKAEFTFTVAGRTTRFCREHATRHQTTTR